MSIPYNYDQYANALGILLSQAYDLPFLTYPMVNAIADAMNTLYTNLPTYASQQSTQQSATQLLGYFNGSDGGFQLNRFCIPLNRNQEGDDVTLGILQANLYSWINDNYPTNFYNLYNSVWGFPNCYKNNKDIPTYNAINALQKEIKNYSATSWDPISISKSIKQITQLNTPTDGYLVALWQVLKAETSFNTLGSDLWTLSISASPAMEIGDAIAIFGENNSSGGFLTQLMVSGKTVLSKEYYSNVGTCSS